MSIPDNATLARVLGILQLDHWLEPLAALADERVSESAHGDFERWRDAVAGLPSATSDAERRDLLMQLAPWRKGPFNVGGVHIDAEWRSDLKWQRVAGAIDSLEGRRVLDVGCGNGYYALRMADAGAAAVLGIDPTLLYVMQFLAVTAYLERPPVSVLPLRLQELPDACHAFDTTFSMGVLYHQRSPLDHLRQLRATLRPGGQLVLETIFIPGEESYACTPAERYARMKNVWLLPTLAELSTWLRRTGFRDVEIIDTAITTVAEQRSTEWMTFESLADALDPEDPTRTVEGWPAPRRVVLTAGTPTQ
jgi:tRNA (mo5U34)-methyltransferase